MSTKTGFGLLETVIALGLFATVATVGITLILHSYSANRLGNEQTEANNLSSGALEIVKYLSTQNFANLTNGTYGLINTAGVWSLTSTPEIWDKFTRTISISDVYRDGEGEITTTPGELDQKTKKITSNVSWNFAPQRHNSVEQTLYLTNYTQAIIDNGRGVLVWGDGTSIPKWNTYNDLTQTFNPESSLPTGQAVRSTQIKTHPNKQEALAGYIGSTGILHLFCFNGTTWSEEWSVTVGGTGNSRRFDIAYEKTSGDALVTYSTNTATNNEMAYRTKPGSNSCGSSNWSTQSTVSLARTNGILHWLKLKSDPRNTQNNIALAWADSNSDLSVMFWDGTTWINEPSTTTETNLERVASSQDSESFDLEYESSSGNLMLIWGINVGSNINGVRYRRCTGATPSCTWGSVTTPPTWVDDATNLDLAPHPTTNEMVFASIGYNQSDLQAGYWNGTSWNNTANLDTATTRPSAYTHRISTVWLNSSSQSRSLITYSDVSSKNIDWVVGNGSSFTIQPDITPTPSMASAKNWLYIYNNPHNLSEAILLIGDSGRDLFAKKITMSTTPTFTWSNIGNLAIETSLPTSIINPYNFAFWESP